MLGTALIFILAIIIFGFNILLLVAISSDSRLQGTTSLLSSNLWLCNCITAVVVIFFNLSPPLAAYLPCSNPAEDYKLISTSKDRLTNSLEFFSARTAAVLFNSTLSLLTLLTIGVVHALSRRNYHLTRLQSSRLLVSTWILVILLIIVDFFLVSLADSLVLAIPFHLALLSVFLVINIVIHITNIIMLTRSQPEPHLRKQFEESVTALFWIFLNFLSFVVIVIRIIWNGRGKKESQESIMALEMTAYSVLCLATPLIAVLRDRYLEQSMSTIMRNKRVHHDDDIISALMRDPPPPYSL
ncbi:unnamed protein product [Auanema sp. JU1783]|nr:unnamed protein product [Auanema sp. JU1783]